MNTTLKWILIAILMLCLIGAALFIYSYYIAPEQKIDSSYDGLMLLEDGSSQPCTVRFQGTLYLNSPKYGDQFSGGYDGGIFINDTRVLQHYIFIETEDILVSHSDTGYFYLDKDMSLFVAKVDAASILEDAESQGAYVVLTQNSEAEYAPIIEAIKARES